MSLPQPLLPMLLVVGWLDRVASCNRAKVISSNMVGKGLWWIVDTKLLSVEGPQKDISISAVTIIIFIIYWTFLVNDADFLSYLVWLWSIYRSGFCEKKLNCDILSCKLRILIQDAKLEKMPGLYKDNLLSFENACLG
ncbi:hypothetical protein [Hymenobacter baengnokdamensis]|uniref:hypothetical protein n=1 Tax=Hymenobacter baengnokdamensis TaxID=2615203 RepID=UPI0012469BAF|nr:hypothetical protein [Hymenobacter baengnokdamensis]